MLKIHITATVSVIPKPWPNLHPKTSIAGTVVIHEDFIPSDVVQTLSKEKISHTVLVPAMIQACLMTVPNVE